MYIKKSKKLNSLSASIGMARKCDRLFKTTGEIKKIIDILSSKKVQQFKH